MAKIWLPKQVLNNSNINFHPKVDMGHAVDLIPE